MEEEVQSAIVAFYQALNALFAGDANQMSAIWSHADDVSYLGPDGAMNFGWIPVWNAWQNQASYKLGGQVSYEQVHIILGKEIAIVQNFERGEHTHQGKPFHVRIRALNAFRKEGNGWKMISHQTDLLPSL